MKKLLGMFTILCVFGWTTASFVQSAPTVIERSPIIQGTLMKIDGPFYVIKDNTGKEQRVHVDKSTLFIGKIHLGAKVKAEVTNDGHVSALQKIEG